MPPTPRIRPYKDFLTPALHRRFALATSTLAVLCYAEAIWVGPWNSFFWSWFPFGWAGIRAGLFFIPAFMIFILRVAQLHVGIRTSYSAWHTFRSYAFKFQVLQTIGWYCLSAYLFSEVYIWCAPKSADLNRIKLIPKTDRPTLNEKPIYLTHFFLVLAVAQAGCHLFYDYDRIDMPVAKWTNVGDSDQSVSVVTPPSVQLRAKALELVRISITRALVISLLSPFIYVLDWGFYPYSIRQFSWSFTRSFAKFFWSLPKSGALPAITPFHWTFLIETFLSGIQLLLLWEVGNAAFSIYVAQEPLKNGRPVTYESRDPNGSLLTGLRGKKLQTRAFAFWELAYIAQRFEGRRKHIFEDIDRKGGSTWSQIRDVSLAVITDIDKRIDEYKTPPAEPSINLVGSKKDDKSPLPRIAKPLIDTPESIFNRTPEPKTIGGHAVQYIDHYARSHGQSPVDGLSPRARKFLDKAETVVLTPKQKEVIATKGLGGLFGEWSQWLLASKIGWIFRHEYRRNITAVVLGSPYGDVGVIVDAITSISRLAVASLTQDKYGNVQRDVKLIIQTFTRTIIKLEAFKNEIGIHWTDVEKKQDCPEVDMILDALKRGLTDLLEGFGGYSQDLGLSQGDMRMAREAAVPSASNRPEMREMR